jgi:hypothetical protein
MNKKPLWNIKGKNSNIKGLGDFGAVESAVTAAAGIIAGISSMFKNIKGLFKKGDTPGDPTSKIPPITNPDGSITNLDGSTTYADGDTFFVGPPPYFKKKDGTIEKDTDTVTEEFIDDTEAAKLYEEQHKNDPVPPPGGGSTPPPPDGSPKDDKTMTYLGIGAGVAGAGLLAYLIFK